MPATRSQSQSRSQSQAADRIAAAKAREHRAELFQRLAEHGQDVDVLKDVPTEALKNILSGLDAAAQAVAAAQAQAAKAQAAKAVPKGRKKDKADRWTASERAHGLAKFLSLATGQRAADSRVDRIAEAVASAPWASIDLEALGAKSGSPELGGARAMFRVLYHRNMLSADFTAELKAIMSEGEGGMSIMDMLRTKKGEGA